MTEAKSEPPRTLALERRDRRRENFMRRAALGDRAGEENVWDIVRDASEAHDHRPRQLLAHVLDAITSGGLVVRLRREGMVPEDWHKGLPFMAHLCRQDVAPFPESVPEKPGIFALLRDVLVSFDVFMKWMRERGFAPSLGEDRATEATHRLVRSAPPKQQAVDSWLRRRVESWPPDTSPPTEAEDLAAAKAAGLGDVRRKQIRDAVKVLPAPGDWRKHGPR